MGPVTNIDPIGNSPVIIKKVWIRHCLRASRRAALQHILRKDFMLQPPWDLETTNKFILHYTYGCDNNLKGELTYGKIGEWRFDKRSYLDGPPPRNLSSPPPGVPESVVTLINLINEATANLPNWDYVD
ncbi:Hydroxyproline O-arabinosyltransferase 3 [Sesamum alatum]|uniref:Hydroxyproline O-arabinosyltransferase 3 n=1 Tax=Sesamum alatum TaxID=300844 RepID=A0AAE1Y1A1_9LAMI|nr:Hydroxyproline O-arabinosyltransferase 3 [Sesamum alatum]